VSQEKERRSTLTILTERLAAAKLRLPQSFSRSMLAYLHSGDVLRQSLPMVMQILLGVWLFFSIVLWFAVWPAIYTEFERWGLVRAFIAQWISLATVFLVARITLHRARHLQALPPDDFVSLRALAVLCRWFGEIALVQVVGSGVSSLFQPISAFSTAILTEISPTAGTAVSSGTPALLLASAPLSLFFVAVAAGLFIVLYSLSTAIDIYLAIEFNTRAERVGRLS
jgi:hypothetical protein